MENVLVTSNWIAWMACVLVDITICVRWTELGEKESPKTRISLKIWKVAAKPKFIENWKNSWKKSRKFMEFKDLERVWTLFNSLTHLSRANMQILGKEIERRWLQKLLIFDVWSKGSFILGEQGMAQWWECLLPTNVAQVQILAMTPYVGWVCCWFSPLLREVFLRVLWFPLS